MSTATSNLRAITDEERHLIDQNFDLHRQFTQAMINDPALMDEVPNDVTLVLVPDDLPDLAEYNIRNGLVAVKRGENVYIRHVYRQPGQSEQQGEVIYGPYPPTSSPSESR